jgi:CRP-like cAMP-binding protein
MLERRLARLLLQVVDRRPGDDLALTQEDLGLLLGARWETVCHATARLQARGVIRHERGPVMIVDALKLRKPSCDCGWRGVLPVSL